MIATWNVRKTKSYAELEKYCREFKPDVICLQEIQMLFQQNTDNYASAESQVKSEVVNSDYQLFMPHLFTQNHQYQQKKINNTTTNDMQSKSQFVTTTMTLVKKKNNHKNNNDDNTKVRLLPCDF